MGSRRRRTSRSSRVLVAALLGAMLIAAGHGTTSAAPGDGPPREGLPREGLPRDDPARGLRYGGLAPGTGACLGYFEMPGVKGTSGCTHGPDPAPEGIDVREERPMLATAAESSVPVASFACEGDGVSGPRVQLVYARPAGTVDRYTLLLPSFLLWAAQMDDVFSLSAAETGGTSHVRFVTDSLCVPTVENVVLSSGGADTFTDTINELRAKGYDRSDRKYLVWMDANVYCGIAELYLDDRATSNNANNGRSDIPGMVGRVDTGCWGYSSALVEAHELLHLLGGVQPSAPNATANGHCTDAYDRMCYADAPGVVMRTVCSDTAHRNRFDCNHDDYFSTAPAGGTYLSTHWNSASSAFLATSSQSPPATGVTGSSWFADGSSGLSGPAGTSVTLFATGAVPGRSYQLVTGSSGGTGQPCMLSVVPVNAAARVASDSGFIGRTGGTVVRVPGQWEVCFREIGTGDVLAVTAPVTFTVT